VIDRCPDDRKSERHVDRPAKREQLHRNQPLIVVAGDDRVELPACRPAEDGVAREWPLDVNAALLRLMNCRAQDRFIFRAQ